MVLRMAYYVCWVPAVAGDLTLCRWGAYDPELEPSNYRLYVGFWSSPPSGTQMSLCEHFPPISSDEDGTISCGLYGDFMDRVTSPLHPVGLVFQVVIYSEV